MDFQTGPGTGKGNEYGNRNIVHNINERMGTHT